MEMSEQIGKVVVGNMLKEARERIGEMQKELAMSLGLANANYLSMIEKGTNTIPVKRLGEFSKVYQLEKLEALTVIRLTSHDVWTAVLDGIEIASGKEAADMVDKETEKLAKKFAKKAGLKL